MKYPKMIIFDYGHTLLYEPGWDAVRGNAELLKYVTKNQFEFVMTSSDYFMRKPNRILFDIALQKAGLCADEVWYCGDNPQADIEGASQAGIYPVWYDNDTEKDYNDHNACMPECEHLHIHEWNEMINLLEGLYVF